MAYMTFPARALLRVDGYFLSEHSRQPLEVEFEPIEWAKRTVKGDLRFYEITKKHKLSTSWELLPSRKEYTIDGYLGGNELYALYLNGGEVRVEVWNDATAAKTEPFANIDFQGRISSFNFSIEKRNVGGVFYDFWNISLDIEEL